MLYFSHKGVTCFAAYCLFTSRLGTVVFTRMDDARLLRYSSLFIKLGHSNFFSNNESSEISIHPSTQPDIHPSIYTINIPFG